MRTKAGEHESCHLKPDALLRLVSAARVSVMMLFLAQINSHAWQISVFFASWKVIVRICRSSTLTVGVHDHAFMYVHSPPVQSPPCASRDPRPDPTIVCPSCSNLLTISPIPADHLPDSEQENVNFNRFECRTCPYQMILDKRYYERKRMKNKEVEDVLGGAESWKNVDKTVVNCSSEKCDNREAYFRQVQIRSADEPMTTFYKVYLATTEGSKNLGLTMLAVYKMLVGMERELKELLCGHQCMDASIWRLSGHINDQDTLCCVEFSIECQISSCSLAVMDGYHSVLSPLTPW